MDSLEYAKMRRDKAANSIAEWTEKWTDRQKRVIELQEAIDKLQNE